MANMQPAYSNAKPLLVCYTITLIHGHKKGVKFCHLQHNLAKKYGPRKTFTKICLCCDWLAIVKIRTYLLHLIFQLVWGLNSRNYKVSNVQTITIFLTFVSMVLSDSVKPSPRSSEFIF